MERGSCIYKILNLPLKKIVQEFNLAKASKIIH